ncbi:hypothetical protein ACIGW4_35325 [Streptomyces sp. NPDC053513]|uniref:hypothetical protein n=1 Tax=unclassified Streptomyces TaxID=2593676 RepID=UPI0037D3CCED
MASTVVAAAEIAFNLERTPKHLVARILTAWSIGRQASIAPCTAFAGLLAAASSPRTALTTTGPLILATPLLLPRRDRTATAGPGTLPPPRTAHQADSFGSLPPAEVVVDDVRVTHRISVLISSFGLLAGMLLLLLAVREYRSGASPLWIGAGAVIFLGASYALVQDVRRLRSGPTT